MCAVAPFERVRVFGRQLSVGKSRSTTPAMVQRRGTHIMLSAEARARRTHGEKFTSVSFVDAVWKLQSRQSACASAEAALSHTR